MPSRKRKRQSKGSGRYGRRKKRVPPLSQQQKGYYRRSGYYGFGQNELKFHDVGPADSTLASGWTQVGGTDLLTIAEGNGENDRIGRKIVIKKIGMRFRITLAGQTSSANTSNICRVALILDKQANGALPTIANANNGIFQSDDFLTFNNLANKSRFRILMDKSYPVIARSGSGDGTTNTYGEDFIIDQWHKEVNIPIEYDSSATDGSLATIRSNNIILAACTQDAETISFSSTIRFRFVDS